MTENWRCDHGRPADDPCDECDLADDLRLYGSCYWKYIDGKKVRVPIEKVRYINNEAMEVGGETVNSATRLGSETEGKFGA